MSKHLSYILRHHPEEAGLELDELGFTDLNKLLDCLEGKKYSWADKEDIEYLIKKSEKDRFEIDSDKIRALYGHSIDVEIKDPAEPPSLLYHGTSPRSLYSILEEGLKPMNRQYVHLSKSKEEAYKVGKRHHKNPVILKIDAKSAWEDGIEFYKRPDVFLTKTVPPKYIYLYKN
ncbi:MAG: RNA 2'-phosphotransferase [Thermoplasmatota archaeon]